MILVVGFLIRSRQRRYLLTGILLLMFGGVRLSSALALEPQQAPVSVISQQLLKQVDQLLALEQLHEPASVVFIPVKPLLNESVPQQMPGGHGADPLRATVIPMPDTLAIGMVLLSLLWITHFWQRRRFLI